MISRSLIMLTAGLLGTALVPALALDPVVSPEQSALHSLTAQELPTLVSSPASPGTIRTAQLDENAQNFTWSAEKTADSIVLGGSTPNPAIKSFLTVRAGEAAEDNMIVMPGGPDDFIDNSLAGLTALNALQTGRVSFTGSKWTLSGYAESRDTLDALLATFQGAVDVSDWLVFVEVAEAEAVSEATPEVTEETVAEPTVTSTPKLAPALLKWSIEREADGELHIDGNVHTAALQSFLRVRAGEDAIDNSEVGGTPPPDFINSALAGVEAVMALQSGRAAFTGSKWTLNGFASSRESLDALLTNLASAVDASDWVIYIQVTPQAEMPAPAEDEPADPEPTAMIEPDFQFGASKDADGQIVLSGNTPSAAFASYASVITNNGNSDALTQNTAIPEGFIAQATTALRALNMLDTGQLSFENDQWSFTGEALSDDAAATVSAAITGLPNGDEWTIDLAVAPVFQLCAKGVAEFSDTHTILFAPASSNLTPESATALADLATDLKKCPAADLHVEGHTDTDGPEDSNMALSVARAEAVIAELIALGLDDRRLYAIGYGETLPVATNDTSAGKAQNRRIVFELVR